MSIRLVLPVLIAILGVGPVLGAPAKGPKAAPAAAARTVVLDITGMH